jgi:HEAT repeat protein
MKEKAQPVLLEATRSPSPAIRQVAVRALGRNGFRDSMAALLAALKDDADYRVRYFAASGLAGYRVPAAIVALEQAMSDPTPTVQLCAAKTLGDMAQAIPADKSKEVLAALVKRFGQYGDGCSRPDAARAARDRAFQQRTAALLESLIFPG